MSEREMIELSLEKIVELSRQHKEVGGDCLREIIIRVTECEIRAGSEPDPYNRGLAADNRTRAITALGHVVFNQWEWLGSEERLKSLDNPQFFLSEVLKSLQST